ncbi:MAG TPA: hypothetical protein PK208_06075 [Fibrobacteria bacterium]|nr:hypothetical protein [Fibrobacteria bacterium]
MKEKFPTRGTQYLSDVFVIGAGASVPYGFPTGFDLIEDLRTKDASKTLRESLIPKILEPGTIDRHFENPKDWDLSPFGKFHEAWKRQIHGSVILTIDQFLKNRPDQNFSVYGKALMAERILSYENDCLNSPAKDKEGKSKKSMKSVDWIQYFLTQIDLQPNWDVYLMGATFISFNYDRVFEYFLRQFLMIERSMPISEADKFIASMKIYHLNGYLGPLQNLPFGNASGSGSLEPWRSLYGGDGRVSTAPDYLKISKNMRTVWETEAHSDREKAQVAIAAAERIFVLGTSYIPENLEAIGLGAVASSNRANLRGTALGLSDAQVSRSAKMLGIRTKDIGQFLPKVTCKDLVVDEVVL